MRPNGSSHGATRHKHLFASIALAMGGIAVALVIGELLVGWLRPTEYLYPRYEVSPEYGLIPFANVVMVHGVPHRFELRYSTNADRCRGESLASSDATTRAVVVLGDSYSFGMGVADGEEFPAVMRATLGDDWTVLNLASPGWGLTQQIRRFYEVGEAYDPRVVILQFGGNDPEDNFINPVTRVRGDEFVFVESGHRLNWTKRMLSKSPLQRTQLYNFVRVRASHIQLARQQRSHQSTPVPAEGLITTPSSPSVSPSAQEKFYTDLLTTFARHLAADGRVLVVVAVDGHLKLFPHIQATVRDLESEGLLQYEEVLDWLAGMPNYHSPDGGHVWGTAAHAVIGKQLSSVIEHLADEDVGSAAK